MKDDDAMNDILRRHPHLMSNNNNTQQLSSKQNNITSNFNEGKRPHRQSAKKISFTGTVKKDSAKLQHHLNDSEEAIGSLKTLIAQEQNFNLVGDEGTHVDLDEDEWENE